MQKLLDEITGCRLCERYLPHGCRPVIQASPTSKMVIIGQAPGKKVHESGVPWQDASGINLRNWMGISEADFYDASQVAILPMGFCYPGKGKSGDLPPRKECAPQWHEAVLSSLPQIELKLLIGQYAQHYYLGNRMYRNLTETVRHFEEYLPGYFVLPHPSPRNRFWMRKNPWFEKDIIPELRIRTKRMLSGNAG